MTTRDGRRPAANLPGYFDTQPCRGSWAGTPARRLHPMSRHAKEVLDPLFPDESSPKPLDRLPYARRVAKLIRTPSVLKRWRQQCQESLRENRQRLARLKAWKKHR